jgi:hypothetical protein
VKPGHKTQSRFGLIPNTVKRTQFGSSSRSKVLLNSTGEPVNVDEVEATIGRIVRSHSDVMCNHWHFEQSLGDIL